MSIREMWEKILKIRSIETAFKSSSIADFVQSSLNKNRLYIPWIG